MTVLNPERLVKHFVSKLEDYANANYLESFVIRNDVSPGFDLIYTLCQQIPSKQIFLRDHYQTLNDIVELASINKGIIISTLNRNESELARVYTKHYDSVADIFPIADLFYSEVLELLQYLKISHKYNTDPDIDEVLKYSEVEWADRENERSNIVTNEAEPKTSRAWFRYTLKQKEILSRLHQREKKTRHKIIHAPIWRVRSIEGLVR